MGEERKTDEYLAVRIDGRYVEVIDKIKQLMPQLNSNKRIVETSLDRFLELIIMLKGREDNVFNEIFAKIHKPSDKP